MDGAFVQAIKLLISLDKETYFIAGTSLRFALSSTLLSAIISLPIGVLLGLSNFRGRRSIIAVLNTLMAMPTVVIGLFVYSLISRQGSLGYLGLLFNPPAIIIGQTVLAFPIIASMVNTSIGRLDGNLRETLVTLGAGRTRIFFTILWEARFSLVTALLAGFGRVIGEVGVSMMLGGNIRWWTRTITTTISLETSKGQFELALALGIVLMVIAFIVNFITHWTVKHES
ncbi:MAG: ABC transporter permease [Spirochaetales bacterium]|uniref:ABC transporter permease n=1 Tax=Candidatus Thalassospirochaeta sargassi TaxID=3119039 RepID=A0AAJ1MLJ6_9SPIO|nr:ABC transporter permease [Spirochaetales bacterium]